MKILSTLENGGIEGKLDEINQTLGDIAAPTANRVEYNNATSGLEATNAQTAIDELKGLNNDLDALKVTPHLADLITDSDGAHGLKVEIGTWTPTLIDAAGAYDSVTYNAITFGKYIKIGNAAFVEGQIKTDAVNKGAKNNYAFIGGFPFVASNEAALTVGYSKAWLTNNPTEIYKLPGNATAALFYRSTASGDSIQLGSAAVSTSANSNIIIFSGMYLI